MTDIVPAKKDWYVCMADGDQLAFYPVIAWIVDLNKPIPILAWGKPLSQPYAVYDPEGTAYVRHKPYRGLDNSQVLELLKTETLDDTIPF